MLFDWGLTYTYSGLLVINLTNSSINQVQNQGYLIIIIAMLWYLDIFRAYINFIYVLWLTHSVGIQSYKSYIIFNLVLY